MPEQPHNVHYTRASSVFKQKFDLVAINRPVVLWYL
jgi:hypothetical protein